MAYFGSCSLFGASEAECRIPGEFEVDWGTDCLSATDPSSNFRITTKQISDIEVGMRVPAHSPDRTDAERARDSTNVDPKTWRVFELELENENGAGKPDLKLLRPAS